MLPYLVVLQTNLSARWRADGAPNLHEELVCGRAATTPARCDTSDPGFSASCRPIHAGCCIEPVRALPAAAVLLACRLVACGAALARDAAKAAGRGKRSKPARPGVPYWRSRLRHKIHLPAAKAPQGDGSTS